jgi:prepilin signal peptidase PulO-like enzyme (type II secretory pathway)
MQIFVLFIIFLFGLSIGSFVNVVILRTLQEETFIKGRSRCDHCRKQIAWYDNIPLLSFIILNGKCRHCKKPIALQHPLVELTTAILFVWWYVVGFTVFQLTTQPLLFVQRGYWLLVGILLLIVLVTDLTTYLIPDFSVVLLSGAALFYRLYLVHMGIMAPIDLYTAIASGIGLSLFFTGLIVATRGRGMGWGDAKLAIALGLILGWPRSVVAVFLAFIVGAIAGLFLVSFGKKSFGQTIPFGPFLVVGTVVSLLYGYDIWLWYVALL